MRVEDLWDRLQKLATNGYEKGFQTGNPKYDDLFSLRRKILLGLTGIPGHGKSVLARNYFVELIKNNPSLQMAGYTPESRPVEREIGKIMECVAGMRLQSSWHNGMSLDKQKTTFDYVTNHFTIINPEVGNYETFVKKNTPNTDHNPKGLRSVLAYMLHLKKVRGIQGFWIDAWNKLEHARPKHILAEEFVSQELNYLIEFLDQYDLFCVLVAHPTKMEQTRGGNFKRPSLYDIKGSSAWNERLDIGLIAHRKMYKPTNRKDEGEDVWELDKDAPMVVTCEKMKFDELGRVGDIKLWMDRKNGDKLVFENPEIENSYEAKKQNAKKVILTSSVPDDDEVVLEPPF